MASSPFEKGPGFSRAMPESNNDTDGSRQAICECYRDIAQVVYGIFVNCGIGVLYSMTVIAGLQP
jgi:hypothetical protein